ncbi:hypothetical protein LCGC14_2176020 [marine sediment metagenome]|uniref:Uncharacterized protein n=1 Tax=marine sediment metagenome TaxID=412755 RepID=A0A0F9G1C2_9ZZZZ
MGNLFDREWYTLWRAALVLDKSSKYADIHRQLSMASADTYSDFDNLYRAIFRRAASLGEMESKDDLRTHIITLLKEYGCQIKE